jgi:ABC-2 type transport system permease protein
MTAVLPILKRELYAFFVSPIAYVLLTAWTLLGGFTFWELTAFVAEQPFDGSAQESPLTYFFGRTTLFYLPVLVLIPVITMRLIAEEKSRGTLEILLTAPVTEVAVILGKYLAALTIWVVLWLPSLLYVWLTSRYGDVDPGTIGASYLGVFGIGVYYVALGLMMSTIAPNQVVAAVLTFMALMLLFLLGLGTFVFGDEYREVFAYVSVWGHMEAFSRASSTAAT